MTSKCNVFRQQFSNLKKKKSKLNDEAINSLNLQHKYPLFLFQAPL
jgi:hypothetical protein